MDGVRVGSTLIKITDVKTFVVGVPPLHFGGRYWIFLKLATDSGVVGYGEVYSVPFHPHVVAKMIEDVCARKVIGSDPYLHRAGARSS